MKLYYKTGACSLASRITLHEIGLPYEAVKVDTASGRDETGADYAEINENGYVPALALDDGEILTENVAILQYLAESHPKAGIGAENAPLPRARLTEALSFINSELHKSFGSLFRPMAPEARDKALATLNRRLESVEGQLGDGRPYLLGERFTVADAYLFVVLNWSIPLKIDLSSYPKIQAYRARVGARPAVQAALKAEGLA
ncbi:glutathione transferase GstA [Neomegalonema perideroedes]|uniref:glutathione transferase GstA n=1 Tax=Neomegalonema perideroedes TaxID=217219 RepID=UPI0003769012|nr:glutathione transferase GstA [Neomegalonema perideroedes]